MAQAEEITHGHNVHTNPYGFFDKEHGEYVITRPDTPTPWINYLGKGVYGGIISNTAGGYSFDRDPRNATATMVFRPTSLDDIFICAKRTAASTGAPPGSRWLDVNWTTMSAVMAQDIRAFPAFTTKLKPKFCISYLPARPTMKLPASCGF